MPPGSKRSFWGRSPRPSLRLRADPEGLDGGVHEAVVAVESAASDDGPVDVLVRLHIDEPPLDDADGMAHLVQRGSVTISSGNASTVVDLTAGSLTPPTVGKSASRITTRWANAADAAAGIRHELQTDVSGEWTHLLITRSGTAGNLTVEWEVIERDDWTVQKISESIADTSVAATLSAVDQSIAFPFGMSALVPGENRPQDVLVRAEITSGTELTLTRHDDDGTAAVRGYVIEWEGATVAAHVVQLDHATHTQRDKTITAVDLAKTFAEFTYSYSGGGRVPINIWLKGHFTTTTNFRLERGGNLSTMLVPVYVISHPHISVQPVGGTMAAGAGTYTDTLDPEVDPTQTFVAAPFMGNAKSTETTESAWTNASHTQAITAAGTLTGTRSGTTATLDAAGFVVEFVDSGPALAHSGDARALRPHPTVSAGVDTR